MKRDDTLTKVALPRLATNTRTWIEAYSKDGIGDYSTQIEEAIVVGALVRDGFPSTPETCMVSFWGLRWKGLGCPTFTLTPDLTAKLILTDPSKVAVSEVKLPFPAMLVDVPLGFLTCNDHEGKRQEIRHLLFHSVVVDRSDDEAELELLYRDEALKRHIDLRERAPNHWHVVLLGERMDGAIIHQEIKLPENALLEDIMPTYGEGSSLPFSTADKRTSWVAVLLLTNLVLYINSLPVLGKPRTEKSGFTKKTRKSSRRIYELGTEIKLSEELRRAAQDTGAQTPKPGWELRSRFTVRGHWRNQPCGIRGQDRKRIWIDPYWKGPELGEQLERNYKAMK